jgi:hypothetical protein
MPLQIRRGTTAQRLAITPLTGELIYDTTTGQLFVGNGTTVGGATTTGISTEDAQDAAASLFTSGSHSGIIFSYNDATGRIDATVTAVGGTGDGVVPGSNYTINIVGDNSSMIVNSSTGAVTASSLSSSGSINADTVVYTPRIATDDSSSIEMTNIVNMKSNLNVDGDITVGSGVIATRRIASPDSSSIEFTNNGDFKQNINVDGNIQVNDSITVGGGRETESRITLTKNSFQNGFQLLTLQQFHGDTATVPLALYRARGNDDAPQIVQNGDDIGNIQFYAYDGVEPTGIGGLNFEVQSTGTVAAGQIPALMRIQLHNGTARATRAELSGTTIGNMTWKVNNFSAYTRGWMGFDSVPRLPVYVDDTAANTAIGAGLTNGMMYYNSTTNKFMGRAAGAWAALN